MNINRSTVTTTVSISAVIGLLAIGLYFSLTINPHSFSWIIATIVNLSLAIFVYLKSKENLLNITFALFSLSVALWAFAVFGLYIVNNEITAFYWSRIAFFGMLFAHPTFLHFVYALTKGINGKNKKLIYSSYGIAVMFLVLNWTGLFITGFVKIGVKYTAKPGIVYNIWLLNFVFWAFYSLIVLFRRYRITKDNKERNQIKYLFIASSVVVIFSFTNALLSFGIKVYPIAGFTTIIYTSIVAYAIVKYQLMNIEVVIKKGIIYASLTAAITAMYALIVGFFYSILGITQFGTGYLWVNALAAMIIAVSFLPLRNGIQLVVDKLFFKTKYDYHRTLRDFSEALSSIIDLNKLLNLIVDTVTETIHIDKVSLMLLDEEKSEFVIKSARGLDKETIDNVKFSKDEHLLELIKKEKVFVCEKFNESVDKLKKLGAVLSVPFVVKDKLIGIFNMGNKLSEDLYNSEDFEFFATMANQAAVTIENAQLYTETRNLERSLFQADKLSALGTLASSIAHEIKNPLQSIKTFSQLILRKFDNPDFRDKFGAVISEETERMENILGELLNISRSGKREFYSVDVIKIIDSLLMLMHNEITASKVKIIKEYHSDALEITADGEQLRQVFMNIILNAVHTMPDGGELTISIRCHSEPDVTLEHSEPIVCHSERSEESHGRLHEESRDSSAEFTLNKENVPQNDKNEFIEISISDTGCGIPKENLDKLFNPFFTTKKNGTGLGLSITRKIIKEHNGTIEVESPSKITNKGTTFTVKLPFDQK